MVSTQAALDPVKDYSQFKAAIEKFKPVIYIHKKEKWYPTPLEHSCPNTFNGLSDAQLKNTDTTVKLANFGYTSFRNSAPLYVHVKKSKDDQNKWNIVYAVWQAYNDCGPDARLTATIGGVGLKNEKITLCPGGVHEGDWEHVTVELDANLRVIQRVYIAYHSFGKWYKPNQLHMENGRPTAYMAIGSHALYRSTGAVKYMRLFEEATKAKILPCGVKLCKKTLPDGIKICKKKYWGVTWKYPCGVRTSKHNIPCGVKTCDLHIKANGMFVDYTPKSRSAADAHRWDAPIRWLYAEGKEVAQTKLSAPERAMAKFHGRGGAQIKNDGWRRFKKGILCATTP